MKISEFQVSDESGFKFSWSTRQASRVCTGFSDDGVNLPTPSQTAIWRRVIDSIKTKVEKTYHNRKKNFSPNIDGRLEEKQSKKYALQVPPEVSTYELSVVLVVLRRYFYRIKKVLDEFNVWSGIQMIV